LIVGPVVHWRLPPRWRSTFVAAISVGLLGWLAPVATLALLGWTALVLWAAPRTRTASRPLVVTGVLVIALVGYLLGAKYLPEFVDGVAGTDLSARYVVPLGVSYFVFKLVHYAIEVGRGRIDEHTPSDVLAWATLFPAFVAGPIERFDHFLQHRSATIDETVVAWSFGRIAIGLVKKLLVGDVVLAELTTAPFEADLALPAWSTADAWFHVCVHFLRGYADFSGYTDIAIGASRLFGIRLMENFDWPLFAPDLNAFWKRWHMTLAGWCQIYIYPPTLGLTRNPYVAVYAVFVVMALWHGLSLNWIFWGLWHGSGVAVLLTWNRVKRRRGWHKTLKIPSWAGTVATLAFVCAAGAFTSTHELGAGPGIRLFAKLFFVDVAP
ncbi:MAG: MBOAT family O-acyltransferase, partial [Myxococcota bacterium]